FAGDGAQVAAPLPTGRRRGPGRPVVAAATLTEPAAGPDRAVGTGRAPAPPPRRGRAGRRARPESIHRGPGPVPPPGSAPGHTRPDHRPASPFTTPLPDPLRIRPPRR